MFLRRPPQTTRRGATIVEVAFVLSIFLLFLYGIFEYGRFVMLRQVLENAAHEGARFAVVHSYDKTTTDVQETVYHYLANQHVQLVGFTKTKDITVYRPDPTNPA